MENQGPEVNQEVVDVENREVTPEVKEETTEELKARLENAKAENARKQAEIQRLREEAELARTTQPVSAPSSGVDLTKYNDLELKAALKNPQDAQYHDAIDEELHKRRIRRINADDSAEIERQTKYPETFDPIHPMAAKMSKIMRVRRLENNPTGRLIAAELAHLQTMQAKAVAAGRKLELDRQSDVNANFSGGNRPAPKASDRAKLEELKKKAMAGDPQAKAEWFAHKGLFDFKPSGAVS